MPLMTPPDQSVQKLRTVLLQTLARLRQSDSTLGSNIRNLRSLTWAHAIWPVLSTSGVNRVNSVNLTFSTSSYRDAGMRTARDTLSCWKDPQGIRHKASGCPSTEGRINNTSRRRTFWTFRPGEAPLALAYSRLGRWSTLNAVHALAFPILLCASPRVWGSFS